MDVSIIIVNYNTKDLLCQCVESIYDKTYNVEFEIIVVDNDSSDGSKELFIKDKRIRFIEAGGNLGFGKANNLGVDAAKGKYVFFLNSDTILMNNAVKLFYDYCECHKQDKLGAVGCLLENVNKEFVHSYGVFPSIWSIPSNLFYAGIRLMTHKPKKVVGNVIYGEEQVVDYVTGADMFVSKATIDKYGAFDSDFFMYYEETDLCYRIKSKGYSIKSIPDAELIHLEGKSFNVSVEREKRNLNGRYLYFHKHYGFFYNVVTDIFNVLTLLIVSIALIFFPKQNKKYIIRLKLYIRKMLNMD